MTNIDNFEAQETLMKTRYNTGTDKNREISKKQLNFSATIESHAPDKFYKIMELDGLNPSDIITSLDIK